MTLFPLVQPQEIQAEPLPLCREIRWDFETNTPVFQRGAPEAVEGAEAVAVWAWKALHTPRYRHEAYSWGYGCELEPLIGQTYTKELKRAEAIRYVREALEVSPYVERVDDITVEFGDGTLRVSCAIATIYGKREVQAHV